MNARRRLVLLTVVGFAPATGLSACSVGPDFFSPAAPAAADYTALTMPRQTAAASVAGGAAPRFIRGKDHESLWPSMGLPRPQGSPTANRAMFVLQPER